MEKQLHFIVGIGRSGTTILSKLLNKYADVHCMPEANFLVFFLHKFRHKTHFSETDIQLVFEEIELYTLTHPLVGWDFNIKEVKASIIEQVAISKEITYTDLCILIYKNFKVQGINKNKAQLLIDKNPSYSIFIDKISVAIPNAKFIWIVRDHRANILSRKQSIYLKSPDVAYNATRWTLYNQDIFNFCNNNPNKVLLIKYEDLVLNYNQVALRLQNFLGVSSNMELTNSLDKQAIKIDEYDIKDEYKERFIKKYSDLDKELNGDRLNVWKEKLSESEIQLCDAICSDLAKEFGYDSYKTINRFKKLLLKINYFIPILKGYIDIYKDKFIYFAPIHLKINRLRKRYTKLGFVKK